MTDVNTILLCVCVITLAFWNAHIHMKLLKIEREIVK